MDILACQAFPFLLVFSLTRLDLLLTFSCSANRGLKAPVCSNKSVYHLGSAMLAADTPAFGGHELCPREHSSIMWGWCRWPCVRASPVQRAEPHTTQDSCWVQQQFPVPSCAPVALNQGAGLRDWEKQTHREAEGPQRSAAPQAAESLCQGAQRPTGPCLPHCHALF